MSGVVFYRWRKDLQWFWNARTQRHVRAPAVVMSYPLIQDRSQVRFGNWYQPVQALFVEWFQSTTSLSTLLSACPLPAVPAESTVAKNLDGVKQHGRLNDNHLGGTGQDHCRRPLTYKNSQAGLDSTLWRKLISSPDILRQRIVLAFTELFVVAPTGIPVGWKQFACAAYMDMLEANCFGNFRALLDAVSLSAAMGVFLNMRGNQKEDPRTSRVPDENYAREVMQLFTIGLYQLNTDGTVKIDAGGNLLETYDQSSIAGLAKVFTGWDFTNYVSDTPDHMHLPMSLIAARHSTSSKSFLGVTVPAGLDGVQELKFALDTIFNHPNVGPFVGRQLIERLVTSNPITAYVGRVAAAFNNNGSGVRGDLEFIRK